MSASRSAMIRPVDRIEEIRVAWERDLEREYAASPYVRNHPPDHGEKDPRIRVDEVIASRHHRVAREAAARLGVDDPYEIVLTPKEKRLVNAQALRGQSPFAIRLIGPVASLLDDGALAALIGHEFGHYLALGPLAEPPSLITEAYEKGASDRTVKLALVASELTADRFSLLACDDLDAMVRLEIAVSLLDSPTALGLREGELLERVRCQVERDEVGKSSRGWIPTELRLYATWLFWRSRLYRELGGNGPADLDLREADRRLRELFEAHVDRYFAEAPGPSVANGPRITGFVSTVRETAARVGGWTDSLAARARQRIESEPSRSPAKVEPKPPRPDEADDAAWSAVQDELAELDPVERRFRELERADEEARKRK